MKRIATSLVRPWAASLLFLGGVVELEAQKQWVPVSADISRRTIGAVVDQETLYVSSVRIEPGRTRPRVVHVYGSLEEESGQYSYSLEEVFQRANPRVAINGGYSTGGFSLPIPAGLLKSSGEVIVPLNLTDTVQSGVLCITSNSSVEIRRRSRGLERKCFEALQAGPILIENGEVVINESERQTRSKYRRTAVCLDRSGNLLLLIAGNPVHLYDFATVLADSRPDGLQCLNALNLGGGSHSGIILRTREGGVLQAGHLKSPIPSAIVVF